MAELLIDKDDFLDFGDIVAATYEGDGWRFTLKAGPRTATLRGTDPSGYLQISGYTNAQTEPFVSLIPYGPGTIITKRNVDRFVKALHNGLSCLDACETLLSSIRTDMLDGKMPTVPDKIDIEG